MTVLDPSPGTLAPSSVLLPAVAGDVAEAAAAVVMVHTAVDPP
ncbi:hypothetical protein [Streptosporangium sp. NPDC051022]